MDSEIVKKLKQKQELENQIKDLEAKRKDLDFVIEYDKKLQAAAAARNDMQSKYKALLRENNKLLSEIDLILSINKFKPTSKLLRKYREDAPGEAIANLGAGDWHLEERIDSADVQGLNRYNPKVAETRVRRMFQVFLRLVEVERSAIQINKAVVYLLGDIVSGYIHDELTESNFMNPSEALMFAEELICQGLNFLLEKGGFDQIEVICHPGNHSRYTKGKAIHHKGRAKKTFEWILYHQLAKIFEKRDKIKFTIPTGTIYVNNEFGFKIRSQHGDDFKYYGGIGGETIPVNKKILRWNQKNPANLDVFGHLHRYTTPFNYICIGSLVGYNEYAMHCGFEYETPKQAFFLVGKKRGLIVNRPIYL